jgi:shikimate dehydrogenase
MGIKAEDYARFLPSLFKLTNISGALVTMPHKVTSLALVDEVSTAARIAGACNAIRRRPDGALIGDMFDGEASCAASGARGAKWKAQARHAPLARFVQLIARIGHRFAAVWCGLRPEGSG